MHNPRWLPLALLLACADDSPECAEPPDDSVITRIELHGTCGPLKPVMLQKGGDAPDGCVMDVDHSSCAVIGHMRCDSGLRRDWWLDGTSGRWVGEDSVQTPTCASVYRMAIEQ